MPLTLRGAREVARRTLDEEIVVLWSEAEAATMALHAALVEHPGADLSSLPEYEDFRVKVRAFQDEAERRVADG